MGQAGRRWKFGWCEYAELSRTLFVHGERSSLRGKPLDVLQILLEQPDVVVPKDSLRAAVWQNTSDQSLTVAISKLRKTFGGELDDIIQNVAGQGYRMAVTVLCTEVEEAPPAYLQLLPGVPIPEHPHWTAVERLGGPDHSPVWLGQNDTSGERRVYKFATDGVRLRALQRELAVAGILNHSDPGDESLLRIFDWNFSISPYFLESEYAGPNLLEFSRTLLFLGMGRADRVTLIAMLAEAVASAHAVGILHNDLKPSNVLVRPLAGAEQVDLPVEARFRMVLVDFGDSSLLGRGEPERDVFERMPPFEDIEDIFSAPGDGFMTEGTEMYRAPEVRRGAAGTAEADVYSLGIMLYQTILGDFEHVPAAGWEADIEDDLLQDDISRSANRRPQERFRTASALAERLRAHDARRQDASERERTREKMLRFERDLERSRAARPWVIAAMATLVAGVLISGWFYRTAVRERNTAQRENRSLQAMLTFLSDDVLAQSNPASGVPGSSKAVDLTLASAILNAVPQIERRFPHDPMVAGKLHETVADGLKSRTQFVDADRQYDAAAHAYREAEGTLSQAAIADELKRDTALMTGLLPGSLARAQVSFEAQQKLIAQLKSPTPQVLVLRDFVESGLLGMGADPAKAVAPLQRAIKLAQASPGFDPMLLLAMEGRYCGLYVRLQDGPKLEAAAKERIQDISHRYGPDNPMLASYEMYLQEAFYLQGKYNDAILQADRNYPRFQHLLGDRNQYTLATLANRAASLAQLGRYPEAVEDDLRLYSLEGADPSGFRMKEGSLNDAALYQCRSGRYREGIENARRVIRETGPGLTSMPAFFNGSKFIVAECLLDQQENSGTSALGVLGEAESLLLQVDANLIAQQTGEAGYIAFVQLAIARIATLRHDYTRASEALSKTDVYFSQPDSDPYELQEYRKLKERLSHVRTEIRADRPTRSPLPM